MISSGGWNKFRRGVALLAAVIGTAGVVAVPGAAGAASASRPVVDSGSPLAGPIGGGGRVTVFGSAFGSADSVLFGSARAPQVHVISAHKLVATTPRHAAGTVSLRVRGPGSTSRAGLSFTFVAPPTLTWSKAHRIDPPSGPPQTISCTGPKFCMATGKQGDVVRWNGSTWTRPTMLSRPGFQTRVSCSSPSFCVVLGQDLRIHIWDGHAWRQGPRRSNLDMDFAPDEVSGLDRLACAPGHHYCVLTAPYIPKKSGWFRIDGHHLTLLGAPRHQRTDNQSQQPLSVSCAAAGHCVTTYLGGYVSTFDHGTFSTTRIAGHGKHPYISCASTKACVATDACVEDEGPPPPCVPDGLAVLRNGSWTEASTGTGVTLKDLSCPATTTCVALHGRDSYTFDPAQPARVSKQDVGAGKDLTGLSCPAADFCVAVDSDPGSAYRRSGGADRPWSKPTLIDPRRGGISDLSCPSASFCAAVDAGGGAVLYRNDSWRGWRLVDPHRDLTSVSCTSASFCMAVDRTEHVVTFNGSRWSEPVLPTGRAHAHYVFLPRISCGRPTFCGIAIERETATGDNEVGLAYIYAHDRWTVSEPPGRSTVITSIACTDTRVCFMSGAGIRRRNADGSWGPQIYRNGGSSSHIGTTNIACVSVNYCAAAGDISAIVQTGTAVSNPFRIQPFGGGVELEFTKMSCPSSHFCAAISIDQESSDTYLDTFNGSAHASPTPPITPRAISCRSARRCVLSDGTSVVHSHP